MAKINPGDYGLGGGGNRDRKPALTTSVLSEADIAVMTVQEARMGIVANGRKRGILVFEETPGYSFWLTLACIQTLLRKLGPDTDAWIGASVPIVKVRVENPKSGEMVVKYNVAPYDEWDDIFHEVAEREAEAAAKAASKPAKRGSK